MSVIEKMKSGVPPLYPLSTSSFFIDLKTYKRNYMAAFPTFESVLIQIANALGASKKLTSKSKNKFKNTEMSIDNMFTTWKKVLDSIFDALELGETERRDLIANIENDYLVHKAVETNVFTFKASPQKIVWQYLARVLIPALARHTVFWQIESKIDAGMPGGKFWYLPFLNPQESTAQIELPLQQVLDWLLDLIEAPKSGIARDLESELRIYESSGTILKNLHNWHSGKTTPEISSIQTTFPDNISIKFKGCFQPTDNICAFEQSLKFVDRKGHNAETLQHEINISHEDLLVILSGKCTQEQKAEFVHKIDERYQQPSTKVIRQRLLVARAVQDGYEQLIKFLTPKTDKFCMDLNQNKVMQLVKLYEATYNHTMKTHLDCLANSELVGNKKLREQHENKLFTQSLPFFLRYDLLLCVSTEDYNTVDTVAPRLSDLFSSPENENTLNDIFPSSPKKIEEISKNLVEHFNKSQDLNKSINNYCDRLKQNKAPFKLLKSINDFKVVYELAKSDYPSPKITPHIFTRLKELEKTPDDRIKRVTLELDLLLSQDKFDIKTEEQVEALLNLAWSNPEGQFWKPYILKLNAYHCIAQNKLTEAEKLLKKAIDECKHNSFGSLRGKLARDAFALAVSNQKLIPTNHETYFRDMLLFGGWEPENNASSINIFDVSRKLHEHFWTKQYRQYPAYEPLYSEFELDFEAFIKDFMPCVQKKGSIKLLVKKHDSLKKKQLKSPQSDSIILLLLKISYDMISRNSHFKYHPDYEEQIKEMQSMLQSQLSTLREVIAEWPQIVDLSDFKQQTPLMMAVDNKDYETAQALLVAGANPNLQDIKGRTALHSACASRTLKCVELLIKHKVDERITSIEGATALHTAIRVGEIEIAKLLMETFPHLLKVKEFDFRTPLMLAEDIATNVDYYNILTMQLQLEKRRVVSHDTYKKLLKILRSYSKKNNL